MIKSEIIIQYCFFFQAEDGIRDADVTGVQTCALPICTTFGDEFGAKHPFHTGQVAMALDGEWRIAMIKDAGVNLDYGVAPFPVPDDQADSYGKGYLSGTVIGIAS